ncbi:MAG TPA: DivIVA domain-containing protein, partial [Coriobacteriia bacterium]|nr:DivIVA domain-containing protein [Coriobacteriia bacterium]
MKLTPLDIHHKEFRHALRGYNEEEVDQFLDQVADEFERLFKENIDLSERIEALQNKVNEFELQRQTINNTLMTAQRSSDDIVARANAEGESIVAHANARAKEIVNDALAKKQQVRGELLRIKQAEEEFREQYRSMLESNLRAISEVGLGDDVSALLGETEESADVADAPGPVYAPEPMRMSDPASPYVSTDDPAPSQAPVVSEPAPP